MNNKPTLFVNSISCSEIGKENQNLYDSRRNIKGKVFHRIDDIIGFISIAKKVFVLLNYSNNIFYGEIVAVNYNYLVVKNENTILSFDVKNISEIKIVSIK